jgi:hypothetical protein
MGALDLVVDGLPDVVEQSGPLGLHDVIFSSEAIMPVRYATSTECCRTFWEKLVRYFRLPSSVMISGCRSWTPTSKETRSPVS